MAEKLSGRVSTGLQRRGSSGASWGRDEQVRQRNAKSAGDAFQKVNGGVFLTAFKAAEVRPIDLRVPGEPFLRQFLGDANATNVPGNDGAAVHGRMMICVVAIKPLDMAIQFMGFCRIFL